MKKRMLFLKTIFNTVFNKVFSTLCLLIFSANAFAYVVIPPLQTPPVVCCFCPYIGFDGTYRHMNWPRNLGGNLFKKDYPEGDVYLGAKFTPFFGIQGGYRVTATRINYSNVGPENILGIFVPNISELHNSRAQFKGWHGEFVGYLPIYMPDCISLFGTLGFSRFQLFQQDIIILETSPFSPVVPAFSTFESTKTILSLSAGLEIKLDETCSFRVKGGWDNTAKFKTLRAKEAPQNSIQPKNSYTYGVGIIFRFF